jgi:hypothetical protein
MPTTSESILDSIKKTLGIDADDTSFDVDVLMHINSVFGPLQQLGVGPTSGFFITDNTTTWTDYTPSTLVLGPLKTYMYIKVRLIFDPPSTSFVIASMERVAAELEWRINVIAESTDTTGAVFRPTWWDLTSLSDFPTGAVTGDLGYDSSSGDIFVMNEVVTPGYMWDLTGLSDFPDDAVVGELGIDTSTGDIWRKT